MMAALYADNYIFVHVPKTAGTSITNALLSGTTVIRKKAHPTFAELIKLTGEQGDRFAFAFVRNPWDRMFSFYNYYLGNPKHNLKMIKGMKFNEWIDNIESIPRPPKPITTQQVKWVEGVDFVGRFENLQKDFRKVCNTLNLQAILPHANPSNRHRSATRHYYDAYNTSARKKIEVLFGDDIETFKYFFV